MHLLGPVARAELEPMLRQHAGSIDKRLGLPLVRTNEHGHCVMLASDGRCSVHPSGPRPVAPRSCRRFPYLLVATPDGGRIGTDHRCPCRTMGARAPITPEGAEASLHDSSGRLSVDRRVGPKIRIEPGRTVGWAAWRAVEEGLFVRLASETPEAALDARPFPPLDAMSWAQVAHDIALDAPDTRWGWALRWFGAHLGAARAGVPGDVLPRPWRAAFDRAEARTTDPGDPDRMLADFVADAVWSMEWALRGTYLHARTELRTTVEVVRSVARSLTSRGMRADRAMAEAILVAEVGAVSEAWTTVVRRFELPRRSGGGRGFREPF